MVRLQSMSSKNQKNELPRFLYDLEIGFVTQLR